MRCHTSIPNYRIIVNRMHKYCDDCSTYVEKDRELLFALDADEEGWLDLPVLHVEEEMYGSGGMWINPLHAPNLRAASYDDLAIASSLPIPIEVVNIVASEGAGRFHVCSDRAPKPKTFRYPHEWFYTGPIIFRDVPSAVEDFQHRELVGHEFDAEITSSGWRF